MSDVVGSASFELRASRDKISSDMEAARQDILAATKKTEAELASLIGTGSAGGNKKAAASFEAPKAAANDAGNAIRASMQAAGAEISSAVKAGSDKAKQELDSLAAKVREVQAVQKPWMPDEAYRKATNVPFEPVASPRLNVSTPDLKNTSGAAKEAAAALDAVGKGGAAAESGLAAVTGGSLGAVAAIGGVIAAGVLVTKTLSEMGAAAMKSASDMAGTAQRIGVSTDALQEWRFVAQKTGETAGAADSAIDSFGKKLAGAASQLSKEDVKAFRTLGFEPEQLKSFRTVEEALDVVTDRIKALSSESARAGIAEKLGLGALSTAFKDNSTDIADLRDQAHKLGVVMDAEVIRRGAEAQGQFETLSGVIDGQLKSAFVDLAPAILAAIGLVAKLATALGNAMDTFRDLEDKTGRGLAAQNQSLRNKVTDAYRRAPGQPGGQLTMVQKGWVRELAESDSEIARRARADIARNNPTDRTVPGGTELIIPPEHTPKGRVDRSAEREARRAERVEEEIARARIRVLGIVDREAQTVQERYETAKAQVEAEREAEKVNLDSRLARKDINQAEFDQLTLINTQTATLEDRVAKDILGRDLADERLAKERLLTDLTTDLLALQSGAARTAAERRTIEQTMLGRAQKQAREDLETRLARTPGLSDADKDQARSTLSAVQAGQRDALNRQNMTPLEAWRDQSLKSIGEVNEAYENIAARGLDALNDGIVDAIMNSKNLGDVFSNVAKQIMADLLAISVRQSITEPLAKMLFGDGKSGGGGGSNIFSAVGSFLKGKIPGFSSGVTNFGGGLAKVHAGELLVNLPQGTDVITAAATRGMMAGGGSGGGGAYFDLRGAVMTQDLLNQMNAISADSERRSNQWAATNVPGLAQSQTAKQQQHAVGRRRR